MSRSLPTQPASTTKPQTDSSESETPDFKNKRMSNAYYWAAQARAFMQKHTVGLSDQFYVEVMAGKAIIVTSPDFPAFDALNSAWVDEGFPTEDVSFTKQPAWERTELDDEVRYFIEPSDERLQTPLVPLSEIDKDEFAHGSVQKPF
jgi:hypothetical protein